MGKFIWGPISLSILETVIWDAEYETLVNSTAHGYAQNHENVRF